MAQRRRRGKYGRAASSASSSTTAAVRQMSVSDEAAAAVDADGGRDGVDEDDDDAPDTGAAGAGESPAAAATGPTAPRSNNGGSGSNNNGFGDICSNAPLVLTSEKRRGVYECDYCHSDISQQPRIRCAVCPDFDLCLDCFATTDHSVAGRAASASSSLLLPKGAVAAATDSAAAAAAAAPSPDGGAVDGDGDSPTAPTKEGAAAASSSSSSSHPSAGHHDDTHGYRVCDSTRYPVFPTGRHRLEAVGAKSASAAASEDGDEGGRSGLPDGSGDDNADGRFRGRDGGQEEGDDGADDRQDETASASPTAKSVPFIAELMQPEDPKLFWTAEEDLRLIDAIRTHGLGNWVDVSEAIGGNGSVGKTAKRCMERYFDDYLGRYGHILPPLTVVDEDHAMQIATAAASEAASTAAEEEEGSAADEQTSDAAAPASGASERGDLSDSNNATSEDGGSPTGSDDGKPAVDAATDGGTAEDETVRAASSKRRHAGATSRLLPPPLPPLPTSLVATPSISGGSSFGGGGGRASSRKRMKVVPTEALAGADKVWPRPYLPATPEAMMGREVARDLACKAEAAFFKAVMAAPTKEEADGVRQAWIDHRMGQVGSPTVLPPRPDDSFHLPGSELAGFMPRRGDFDVEWENDAEAALADMEFLRGDTAADRHLKLQVLEIYVQKLDAREKRKAFVLNRHLYDYRQHVQDERALPVDERDLVHRMRLFERFHTPDEHRTFIADILHAKRLRKEIAKLQMYRRIGIRSLAEAERYELDKNRYQFHKMAQLQREAEAKAKGGGGGAAAPSTLPGKRDGAAAAAAAAARAAAASSANTAALLASQKVPTDSLWKQYKTNDRKSRRSGGGGHPTSEGGGTAAGGDGEGDGATDDDRKGPEDKAEGPDPAPGSEAAPMEIDDDVAPSAEGKGNGMPEHPNTEDEGTPLAGELDGADGADKGGDLNGEDVDNGKQEGNPASSGSAAVATKEEAKDEQGKGADEGDFDISNSRGIDLLSKREKGLCERLRIYPIQYLEIKKALIHEALVNGLLDKDSSAPGRRTIVKIDVERRGDIVEFLLRAGWISRKLANAAVAVASE